MTTKRAAGAAWGGGAQRPVTCGRPFRNLAFRTMHFGHRVVRRSRRGGCHRGSTCSAATRFGLGGITQARAAVLAISHMRFVLAPTPAAYDVRLGRLGGRDADHGCARHCCGAAARVRGAHRHTAFRAEARFAWILRPAPRARDLLVRGLWRKVESGCLWARTRRITARVRYQCARWSRDGGGRRRLQPIAAVLAEPQVPGVVPAATVTLHGAQEDRARRTESRAVFTSAAAGPGPPGSAPETPREPFRSQDSRPPFAGRPNLSNPGRKTADIPLRRQPRRFG